MRTLFPRQSIALARRTACAALTDSRIVAAAGRLFDSTAVSSWLPRLSSWLEFGDFASPESEGRRVCAAVCTARRASSASGRGSRVCEARGRGI
ncbi:hypothetical protein AB1Y20_011380 [Prymnesium parvum]|uniref:Uncharacterized protein n=1 Tax=Prymnesium parvum TaxID=97485 RepID=A0AB34IP59_PRYPA